MARDRGIVVAFRTEAQKVVVTDPVWCELAVPRRASKASSAISGFFSRYRTATLRRANLGKITVCSRLGVNGSNVGGTIDAATGTLFIVAGANEGMVHHEFMHLLDARMQQQQFDPAWQKLNPPGFRYRGYNQRPSSKTRGFASSYAMAAMAEDKAELYMLMVMDPSYIDERAQRDPHLAAKRDLLRQRLAAFSPDLGPAFWRELAAE
jgi:hypothetical protein